MNRWKLISIATLAMAGGIATLGQSQPAAQEQKKASVALEQPLKDARMTVQRVQLRKPVEIFEAGTKRTISTLLEFRVASSEPIPARALDPVLYVGDTIVKEYRYADEGRTLVFLLYDPAKARDNAATYLQYGDQVATRTELPKLALKQIKLVRR